MIGIIIVTHGQMGAGLLQSVQAIVGHQDAVEVITIAPHDSLAEIRDNCNRAYTSLVSDGGVLIVTDILGGTSCNASLQLVNKDVEILTGVNLPMLISAMVHRKHLSLNELAMKVLEDGKKSIIDARGMLLKRIQT